MNLKKIMIISILLLAILTVSAASANDNLTIYESNNDSSISKIADDNLIVQKTDEISLTEDAISSDDDKIDGDYNIKVNEDIYETDDDVQELGIRFFDDEFRTGTVSISIDNKKVFDYKIPTSYAKYADTEYSHYYKQGEYYFTDLKYSNLDYGIHKAEITYYGDPLFKDIDEVRYFNYSSTRIYVPEAEDTIVFEDISEMQERFSVICVNSAKDGHLKILIDKNTIFDALSDGYEYIYLNPLTLGEHDYEIIYTTYDDETIIKRGSFNATYNFDVSVNGDFYDENEHYDITDVMLSVFLPHDATSNLTLKINNRTYSHKLDKGHAKLKLNDLKIGENIIYITYKDENYYEKTIKKNITVVPHLEIPTEISYQDESEVTLILANNTKGILKVKINNIEITSELINGSASIQLNQTSFNMTSLGTYKMEISYTGDDEEQIHKYFTLNNTLTLNPNINIPKDIWINGTLKLEFKIPEKYNGTLYVNGYNASVKNGKANATITKIKKEPTGALESDTDYALHIIYCDNGNVVYEENFFVNVHDKKPTYWIEEEKIEFDGEMLHVNDNGKLQYYIDEDPNPHIYDSYIDPWEYWMEYNLIDELSPGNHTLVFSYLGDEYFMGGNKTITVNVGSNVHINFDYYNNIVVEMPNDTTGTLEILVNNTKHTINVDKTNEITIPLNLTPGEWDINVKFYSNYGNFSRSKTLNIIDYEKNPYNIFCFGKNTYGSEMPPEDFTFLVDGKPFKNYSRYHGMEEAGTYFDFSDLPMGNHILEIIYKGHEQATYNFTTLKDFQIKDDERTYTDYSNLEYPIRTPKTIHVIQEFPKDAKGNLSVSISSEKFSEYVDLYASGRIIPAQHFYLFKKVEIKNGKADIAITNNLTNISDHLIKISYDTANYGSLVEYFYLITENSTHKHITYPSEMRYGDKQTLIMNLDENATGMIGMFGKGFKPVYSKIINGTAAFPLSTMPICNGISVTFVYNNAPGGETYDLNLTVKGYTPKLIGSKKAISMYYDGGATYSLKVSGVYGKIVGKGETVTFKIGKNTFNIKTNKNGVATLKIYNKVKPGKYTIVASYKGVKVTKKLTVKQILKIKTVNVKKSAKKLILTATLKKGKKAIKNKKITFKFNGKTYNAKTNKKGIAKVTIKKSVLKKLKVGKKVIYQATYLKNTVKKTAKVKR